MVMYYVYEITCAKTGNKYIGFGKNAKARFNSHMASANIGDMNYSLMTKDRKRHGRDSFSYKIVFESINKDDALEAEMNLYKKDIHTYNSSAPKGSVRSTKEKRIRVALGFLNESYNLALIEEAIELLQKRKLFLKSK